MSQWKETVEIHTSSLTISEQFLHSKLSLTRNEGSVTRKSIVQNWKEGES